MLLLSRISLRSSPRSGTTSYRAGSSFIRKVSHRLSFPSLLPKNQIFINPCYLSTRSFATMTGVERLADHLEAPELDDRSYRVIRLPNRLEALLAHDPDTDKASASVNVNVGSFSDADDMPGMAHAVEHLLFMGTEKVMWINYRGQ